MDNAVYAALGRQAGLRDEMRLVANNLANASTSGFRRETTLFSEVVSRLHVEGGSISMGTARVRVTDFAPGSVEVTGGPLDLAVDGPGFFQVETPDGPRLTRSGAFAPDAAGVLRTPEGHALLDEGGAPLALPAGAGAIVVAGDGSVAVDGRGIGRIAAVAPADPASLSREGGKLFRAEGPVDPTGARILQGELEGSNVSPVEELARMIEVQRAYELGANLLTREDERIRSALRILGGGGA